MEVPIKLLSFIENISDMCNLKLTSEIKIEKESIEYGAYNFSLNDYKIFFRIGKITPKKIGHFVTLWKRDKLSNKIVPLNEDNIDFLILDINDDIFIFNQQILREKNILSTKEISGKTAFRIYGPSTLPISQQAVKTQKWQLDFLLFKKNDKYNINSLLKLFGIQNNETKML